MSKQKRRRQPLVTRQSLLDAALGRFQERGFQGTGLSELLRDTGLTKGAFYFHFPSKLALGYSLIEQERERFVDGWLAGFFADDAHPVDQVCAMLDALAERANDRSGRIGDFFGMLAYETSDWDEGFRERIEQVFTGWAGLIQGALEQGIEDELVHPDLDPGSFALQLLAAVQGAVLLGKISANAAVVDALLAGQQSQLELYRL